MADEVFYGLFAVVILLLFVNALRSRIGNGRKQNREHGQPRHLGDPYMKDDLDHLNRIDPTSPASPEYVSPGDRYS